MNRNVFKIIGVISMLVDHIGCVFFPNIIVFRIIGRLAFPIFAYFLAEGYFYTHSKKKYILRLLLFAVISWVPFNLAFNKPMYVFNILGIFLLSILGMYLIDKSRESHTGKAIFISLTVLYFVGVLILEAFSLLPEGFFGVLLPILFYCFRKNRSVQLTIGAIDLIAMSLLNLTMGTTLFSSYIQFFSLISILLLIAYNGNKGKANLKYLFYTFYPAHLLLLWGISLLI